MSLFERDSIGEIKITWRHKFIIWFLTAFMVVACVRLGMWGLNVWHDKIWNDRAFELADLGHRFIDDRHPGDKPLPEKAYWVTMNSRSSGWLEVQVVILVRLEDGTTEFWSVHTGSFISDRGDEVEGAWVVDPDTFKDHGDDVTWGLNYMLSDYGGIAGEPYDKYELKKLGRNMRREGMPRPKNGMPARY